MAEPTDNFIDTQEGITLVVEGGGHARGATGLEIDLRDRVRELEAENELLRTALADAAQQDDAWMKRWKKVHAHYRSLPDSDDVIDRALQARDRSGLLRETQQEQMRAALRAAIGEQDERHS